MELEKIYEPHEIEKKYSKLWIEQGVSTAKEKASKSYSVVIPPPNVTGTLHIGHALNNTLQDILVRYKRMRGYDTLWVFGTDHAGIATQNVVERQLAQENLTRYDLGREAFISRVWKWKEESGGTIRNQLKSLGASLDWSRERFTMDDGLSKAVREVFVSLYEDGLLYRDQRLIHWCPRCQTSLSDLEVEHEEKNGQLWHIRYFLEGDGDHFLSVATTRPETLLGDTAVAVNPADERYKQFVGQNVVLPFLNRLIPVIADSYVDQEFGSGVVKITPAHDFNDFEVGKRHGLERINILHPDGRLNENAGSFENQDRFAARKQIVKLLEEQGQIEKVEPHKNKVGHCYRCKTVVEPYLSLQWFVKTEALAKPAIEAVKSGKTKFHPGHWEKTYFAWMENIKDWCVSRQIWWGHRIPAWYCGEGHVTVTRHDPKHCATCHSHEITQDQDVLDTWFSSALWPFSTLGWPDKTNLLKSYYPTSVLVTSFDIIFFWVARMMMMGLKFMGEVPFKDVYIHALVRDAQGQKMSKSKGNVVNPLELMDKFGTDALRFTLAAFAAQGRDIKLDEQRVEGYRNFCNKIWNAARFLYSRALPSIPNRKEIDEAQPQTEEDEWILFELSTNCVEKVSQAIEEYKYNVAAYTLYHFVWQVFCDWYIELVKTRLPVEGTPATTEQKACAGFVLNVFDAILRMLHPFMPFISEELWQKLPERPDSIALSEFPKPLSESEQAQYAQAAERTELMKDIVSSIRNIRAETGVNPKEKIRVQIKCSAEIQNELKRLLPRIQELAKISEMSFTQENPKEPASKGLALAGKIVLFIPLSGLIDIEKEKARLQKKFDKVQKDISLLSNKLALPSFIENAPEELIKETQAELESRKRQKEEIEEGLGLL
ncbi:MAG: valine--tRNA ligase [Deltaproteobacteria bacterium]|nr:valine--tRNA ligase [Deltaproteobacteria bacterium]